MRISTCRPLRRPWWAPPSSVMLSHALVRPGGFGSSNAMGDLLARGETTGRASRARDEPFLTRRDQKRQLAEGGKRDDYAAKAKGRLDVVARFCEKSFDGGSALS
jgi:hypothetical protein